MEDTDDARKLESAVKRVQKFLAELENEGKKVTSIINLTAPPNVKNGFKMV